MTERIWVGALKRAEDAIGIFVNAPGLSCEDEADALLVSALVDLRYWADKNGVEFDRVSRSSKAAYDFERLDAKEIE